MSTSASSSNLWKEIQEVPGEIFDEDGDLFDYDDQADFGLTEYLNSGNDF